MAETETEFGQYTGDCVWAAVHMAAHRLRPLNFPLPDLATLNSMTTQAIQAGIGVGPRGEATAGQLEIMLGRWGFGYTRLSGFTPSIPADTLRTWLDDNVSSPTNKPVLLGFQNGQALTGDEVGLHGHEIVVLHPYDPTHSGYACGDGDSQAARNGQLSYYSLDVLMAAQPDSAYVVTSAPEVIAVMLNVADTAGKYVQKQGDDVWTCTVPGHQFDVQHGVLAYYRQIAPSISSGNPARLPLPLENLVTTDGNRGTYKQAYDEFTIVFDGPSIPQAYLSALPLGPTIDVAGIRADAQAILQKVGG